MLTQDLDPLSAKQDGEQVCPDKHLHLVIWQSQSHLQVRRDDPANHCSILLDNPLYPLNPHCSFLQRHAYITQMIDSAQQVQPCF